MTVSSVGQLSLVLPRVLSRHRDSLLLSLRGLSISILKAGGTDDPEDLVQALVTRLLADCGEHVVYEGADGELSSAPIGGEPRPMLPWLREVARRVAIDRLRACQAHKRAHCQASAHEDDDELLSRLADKMNAPPDELSAKRDHDLEIRKRLLLYLRRPADRHLMELRFYEELDVAQIASRLGMGESAVKMGLRRLLARMQADGRLRELIA